MTDSATFTTPETGDEDLGDLLLEVLPPDGSTIGNLSAREAGLIQSVSQALLPGLRAWVEVGGIAPSQCSKAFLPQPILT